MTVIVTIVISYISKNIIEKKGALQKEIKEITKKNEELKVHLDELMENQSKHDVINKNFIEKEIEKFLSSS